ncbi:MAG: hypothetical protein SNJ71_08175, partial [Bacteroidales bacterium]
MSNKIQKMIKELKRRGYRNSRLKKRIIEIIFRSKKPISVPEIIEKLDIGKIAYNKSSVYREINKLLSEDGHRRASPCQPRASARRRASSARARAGG